MLVHTIFFGTRNNFIYIFHSESFVHISTNQVTHFDDVVVHKEITSSTHTLCLHERVYMCVYANKNLVKQKRLNLWKVLQKAIEHAKDIMLVYLEIDTYRRTEGGRDPSTRFAHSDTLTHWTI